MNRNVMKYVAVFTMLLNHIAVVLIPRESVWYWVLTDVGYFAAVTMCYFLVEGCKYTRSVKLYRRRILIFALLSQIPYSMAFAQKGVMEFRNLNMLFTLYLCIWIIQILDSVPDPFVRGLTASVPVLGTALCDWPILAAVYTMLFVWAKESKVRKKITFCIAAILLGETVFISNRELLPMRINLLNTFGAMFSVLAAGYCILRFYRGKRMEKGGTFSKWFFYVFYPAHLMILAVMRIYMQR